MAGCEKIIYKDKEILFFDHVGLLDDDLLNNIKKGTNMILDSKNNDLLCIGDFTGTFLNSEIMAYLKSSDNKIAMKKVKKMAVIGITGLKKLFLKVFNSVTRSGARPLDNLDAAKEYVVSE